MTSLSEFGDPDILRMPAFKQRKSTIMIDLIDPSVTVVDLQKLLEAGMDVTKLSMSHTTKADKMKLLGRLDKASEKCCQKYSVNAWPVGSCVVLKTCVVKTGIFEQGQVSIKLKEGSHIILTNNIAEYSNCNSRQLFVDNHYLTKEVSIGTEITIGLDGAIMICTEILGEQAIKCLVTCEGEIFNLDYVAMRDVKRISPPLCNMDYKIIKFALEFQIDMIVIYYVRRVETLINIKKYIGKKTKRPFLISGISTQEGLNNFEDIVKESDAILLAREFLTSEMRTDRKFSLSKIQKWLGAKCQSYGKPYLLSGFVFQDSLNRGDYTDREVSDVTNALFDGVTGFVLKNFQKIDNVVEALRSMNELCRSIEPYIEAQSDIFRIMDDIKMPSNAAEASMLACVSAARQMSARVIVIPTVTGCTARTLLRMKPNGLVLTVSTKTEVMRMLSTFKSIVALLYTKSAHKNWHVNIESRVNFAVEYAVKRGWLVYGDFYVSLQRGSEHSSYCDTIRIWPVTISKKSLVECEEEEHKISVGNT